MTANRFSTASLRRLSAGLFTVAALLLGQGALAAGEARDAPSIVVKYGDLDLGSDAGARAVYDRIAAAARKVCPSGDVRDLRALAETGACREVAVTRALGEIRNPQLAARLASVHLASSRSAHAKTG